MSIDNESWYLTIASSSNPTVRGYLAEQICLSRIARHGLSRVGSKLGDTMGVEYFEQTPNWTTFFRSGDTLRLYLPKAFNFPDIDAAILQRDLQQNTVHLYPIQITLATKHKDSASLFYQHTWGIWERGLSSFAKVESTFVWISENGSTQSTVPGKTRVTWARAVQLNPEYKSFHMSLKEVDERLYNVLCES